MLCFVFAALVVLLDQFFKHWILLTIDLHENMPLLPGLLDLTNVRNTGAAFSIFADQRWLLIAFACVAVIFLIAILLRYNEGFWGTLGLAAILGGAIGNLVDRISYGYVVDMFELRFINFAIFNIADIFITLGGITFLVYFIVTLVRPAKSTESITGNVSPEYIPIERPHVEEEIGLYDFQYGEDPHVWDEDAYDSLADTGYAPDLEPQARPDYPEPDPDGFLNETMDRAATLASLSNLEQELLEAGLLEDSDIDEMLREYGFDNDAD